MTFYEQLKKHLSVKQHVLVQDKDGEYCVFSHFTDSSENWKISEWQPEEKWATNNIGSYPGWNRAFINKTGKEEKWKIVKAFDIPTGRFQVGDMVFVSEDAGELCEISDVFFNPPKEMFGKVCEIKEIFNTDYNVYTPDKSDWFTLPHSALSYPIETEEKSCSPGAFYKGKIFEMFVINIYKDGRIQITTEKDLGFQQDEKITLNDCVYTIKEVRHNSPNFFMYNDFIVIEAYPEEENTAAQEAIELLEKNGYVISKK